MTESPLAASEQALRASFDRSPEPSYKVSNYFAVYADLFQHLRGRKCTFVETGVSEGGSLFMWRDWLGEQARIIGIDLNPEVLKWRQHGFEIYVGDQGDPAFWRETFEQIGAFDAFLDDGGHQSFQQIVTVHEAIRAATQKCVIAVEDTCTSLMREFARHGRHSFLEYAKAATDTLLARTDHFFPGQFPPIDNLRSVEHFRNVCSIQFYSGIVAFKIDPAVASRPQLVRNKLPARQPPDFRYGGAQAAVVEWPNPFLRQTVRVDGGRI